MNTVARVPDGPQRNVEPLPEAATRDKHIRQSVCAIFCRETARPGSAIVRHFGAGRTGAQDVRSGRRRVTWHVGSSFKNRIRVIFCAKIRLWVGS